MFDELTITNKDIEKAKKFQIYRDNIKAILNAHGRYFDKFTCTTRDAFDGYLAEKYVEKYLKSKNIPVSSWNSENNLSKELIYKILNLDTNSILGLNSFSKDEITSIEKYFYDKWDLDIDGIGKTDVKCAATHLFPQNHWTYGIPKIQINKSGKEAIFLAYIIYDKDPKKYSNSIPIKCVFIGYKNIEDIKRFEVVTKNIKHNYIYHTPNYELEILDFISIS